MPTAKLSETKFNVNLGFIGVEATWEIDDRQKSAAWEMYVELATRITTAELKEEEGLLRESLTSLHELFSITRNILKKYGPSIATANNPEDITFGHLAVSILNKVIRPILSKWHPLLLDWEQKNNNNKTTREHELDWEHSKELREILNEVRTKLIEYANVLGDVSGVANLIE